MIDSRAHKELQGEAAVTHLQSLCTRAEEEPLASDQLWLQETIERAAYMREEVNSDRTLVAQEWQVAIKTSQDLQEEMFRRLEVPCP